MDQKLTNVHEALADAVQEDQGGQPMVHKTFRIQESIYDEAAEICQRHGTTMSSFLRHCCIGLVRDYRDPQVT